jgi:hypothetical protein
VEHDTRHFVEYVQSALNYGDRLQRQIEPSNGPNPVEPYIASQTADYWYQEGGVGYRLAPHEASPVGWKVVAAFGLQTQPAHPFVPFNISSYLPPGTSSGGGGGSATGAPVEAQRTIFPTGRFGLRYDFTHPKLAAAQGGGGAGGNASGSTPPASGGGGSGKKGGGQSSQQGGAGGGSGGQGQSQTYNTFVEFGYEHGNLYHAVSSYLLQAPSDATLKFNPTCGVADINCLMNDATIAAAAKGGVGTLDRVFAGREHQQQGAYFNFRIDGPLPVYSNAEFVFENRGDWFIPRRGDLRIDTRLSSDFKASLVVQLWQKINLSPSVESIFFQAQSTRNFYHSFSTSVSLNYSFEWHPGIGFFRALRYSNPVPTQPTLPVK